MGSEELDKRLAEFERRMATRVPRCGTCGEDHESSSGLEDGQECDKCALVRENREAEEAKRNYKQDIRDLKDCSRALVIALDQMIQSQAKGPQAIAQAIGHATKVAQEVMMIVKTIPDE